MRDEINRIIGILKIEACASHRKTCSSIRKIFKIKVSLGKICACLKSGASRAKEIQKYLQAVIKIKISITDEIWVKIKGFIDKWGYGLIKVAPKSLFLSSFECLVSRTKETIKERRNSKKAFINIPIDLIALKKLDVGLKNRKVISR